MQDTTLLTSHDQEREELKATEAALARRPRLAKLLRYLAEKYFDGEADQLTEYNIATEVFSRQKTKFIASEDAIARVETHRLRKKLKEFYESEGKDHLLHISIPLGTYTPSFLPVSERAPARIEKIAEKDAPESPEVVDENIAESANTLETPDVSNGQFEGDTPATARSEVRIGALFYASIGVFVCLAIIGFYAALRHQKPRRDNSALLSPTERGPKAGMAQIAQGHPSIASPNSVPIPFRMIAGYSGPSQKDSVGNEWKTDQYFRGGWALRHPPGFIGRTGDALIFRYGRAGDFSYDIPVKPGLYELHLYFLQASETDQSEDAENKAVSNVAINGQLALRSFDIVSDAMGRNLADERVLRDVSPSPDGAIHLHLSTVVGTPSLSAIEILDGSPHKQIPIRIITQPNSFTDRNGLVWHSDDYFLGGRHLSHNIPVTNSSDPDLIATERYGHFTYAFPVDTRDRYTVVLHFAELFFGTGDSGENGGTGLRTFRVVSDGSILLDDFDIYKESGPYRMLTKTFHHLKPTAQGKIDLTFEPISNYATVSAIEVLDESNQPGS